jgi:hypothetical protein
MSKFHTGEIILYVRRAQVMIIWCTSAVVTNEARGNLLLCGFGTSGRSVHPFPYRIVTEQHYSALDKVNTLTTPYSVSPSLRIPLSLLLLARITRLP